jgi:cephalosporin hydroxylase
MADYVPVAALSLLGFAGVMILAYMLRHRLVRPLQRIVVMLFHYFYYRDGDDTWANTRWMGVPLLKLPLDLWIYQEIVYETRPTLIIETGTSFGGSGLFFANLFDLLSEGKIITVDVVHRAQAVVHPRIEYILGSSTEAGVVEKTRSRIRPEDRVMVVLDSDHTEEHVRRELELYAPFVTPGCYLVLEDTNVNGHPVSRSHGPGPMEALKPFLSTNPDFVSDRSREKFKLTFNPHGWLKRMGASQLKSG